MSTMGPLYVQDFPRGMPYDSSQSTANAWHAQNRSHYVTTEIRPIGLSSGYVDMMSLLVNERSQLLTVSAM